MEPDMPARTLTAHLGKDTYSHIHYDSEQSRVISVREAARLQSFPDGFVFSGAMNAAFRQIGNAVPPLQAFSVANQIKTLLETANPKNKINTINELRPIYEIIG
jgi:DNA (cytosine-5)-methyltransferase 1